MALQQVRRSAGRRGTSHPPRSRAFFLELLLNMLIFALCAVVVLQVFAEGKITTDESAALTQLTLDAEALAEDYKASQGNLEELLLRGEQGQIEEDGSLTYYYNNDFELVQTDANVDAAAGTAQLAQDGASVQTVAYTLRLSPVACEGEFTQCVQITATTSSEDELFSFMVTSYQPRGGR